MTKKKLQKLPADDERAERRALAEADLVEFINLVHPKRSLGNIHREVIKWWTAQDAKKHQLLLLPRDHMKSALIAYRVAWELTKNPTLRVLYISSTRNLATKQLKFIKDIITNDTYRLYWPDMVEKEEAKREKWTESEISLDHPRRKEESIRDPSIFTAGLTSNIVGMHCDISVLDDVVVAGNAYTEEGREKVREQYGYLSSVEGAGAREWVVGTRYHPSDLYSSLIEMDVKEYDEHGKMVSRRSLFDVKEHPVETAGDGTGEFLWPRQQRYDGMWFGFDQGILNDKKSQYLNQVHFRAQYYNDPHDVDSSAIQRNLFQYYNKDFISRRDSHTFYRNERLNVYASIDFAYSIGEKSDYTSIVVVGIDGNHNYYILDIDRFKTNKHSEYFSRMLKMHEKWGFRKIRAEVSAAQISIVNDLRENYIRKLGLALTVEEFRPSRWQGSKEERIGAILEPRYANRQIWHYTGGYCDALEEELLFANPAHDDIKDALASCLDSEFCLPPTFNRIRSANPQTFNFHSRWGGVA